MHNFRELKIWKLGVDIASDEFAETKSFPKEHKYDITSQINKSCISISSNIAEGSARTTNKEFSRFLDIAQGSAYELETHLILSKKVELLREEKLNKVLPELNNLQKMIAGFKRSLN